MRLDPLALAVELRDRDEAFALATVVRCEPPTSAKPGAKALIRGDGSVVGWIGGACAEPVVVREALAALLDGEPRLVALVGEGGAAPGRTEGLVTRPMTCHSGGTLEIYVEPFLPKPELVLIGHGPVLDALAALAQAADFRVVRAGDEMDAPLGHDLAWLPLGERASIVVATHGRADEEILEQVLTRGAQHVSVIASRKRAATIVETLRDRGVSHALIDRVKAPAGMDIGAVTPAEIAVSILAELVQQRRARKPSVAPDVLTAAGPSSGGVAESRDPVCGMMVDVASSRHRSQLGATTVHFCCRACKQSFDRAPEQYAVGQ